MNYAKIRTTTKGFITQRKVAKKTMKRIDPKLSYLKKI